VRFADILGFAFSALYQQKVRTVLTTLGVIIGTFVLALSLAVGLGVQDTISRQFRRHDQLRKIEVWPTWGVPESQIPPEELAVKGRMSDAKKERIRQALIRRWNRTAVRGPQVALTRDRVKQLEALDHVAAVTPLIRPAGYAVFGDRTEDVTCIGTAADDVQFRGRVVAGAYFPADDARAVVVSEFLLYRWGVTDDDQVAAVVGQNLRLELRSSPRPNLLLALLNPNRPNLTREQNRVLRKALQHLPAALEQLPLEDDERDTLQKLLKNDPPRPGREPEVILAEEFTVAGVLRCPEPQEQMVRPWHWPGALDDDLVLPLRTAERLYLRVPGSREQGFDRATVTVDREENVQEVTERVAALGLGVFSLAHIVEQLRLNALLISFATAFVAGVALLVAALGIINTMLMTVLERTHEIGVMKAVGARDGHVQLIFLVEGAFVGLVGGALGLLLGWAASFPGDAMAQSIVEKQTQSRMEESLFVFPWWLVLGLPLFAGLVTTLAALYPARRAAKVNPITALRHE
jgi:putative ABC transport system permease protein